MVARHVVPTEAALQEAADAATVLRRQRLSPDSGVGWPRAALAQLVVYPTRHLTSALRRRVAVRNGASARPGRDLRTAGWAAPLRDDPGTLELLVWYLERTCRVKITDRAVVPEAVSRRLGVDAERVDERLATALRLLRQVNPGFYAANVEQSQPLLVGSVDELATVLGLPVAAAQPSMDDTDRALPCAAVQAILARLVTARVGESAVVTRRRYDYRAVLRAVCLAGDGDQRQGMRGVAGLPGSAGAGAGGGRPAGTQAGRTGQRGRAGLGLVAGG